MSKKDISFQSNLQSNQEQISEKQQKIDELQSYKDEIIRDNDKLKKQNNSQEKQLNELKLENEKLFLQLNQQKQESIQKVTDENIENQLNQLQKQLQQLQKQVSVLQNQNLQYQDQLEVQKREFITYMNAFKSNVQIESFDKLPIFSKIMNDIENKAKLKSQENQIRSLHKQAESIDKLMKLKEIEVLNVKTSYEMKYFQLTKQKNYVQMTKEWQDLNKDLEIQIHNLKSMIQIQENEINDKKIEIKLLNSGQKFSVQQIQQKLKKDYKIIEKNGKFKYQKEGKTDYVYIESEQIKENLYIDEISIFGCCGGYNSYIYITVYDQTKNCTLTPEFIIYRNLEPSNIFYTQINNFKIQLQDGEVLSKMQQRNAQLRVIAKSNQDQSLIIIGEISIAITYLNTQQNQ